MIEQPSIELSVVVVVYDMARELPRTLRSLAAGYQRGIDADAFEVIVVDNGSAEPLNEDAVGLPVANLRLVRLDPAPSAPARAANLGIELARSDYVGLIVDGARMASPGLLAHALLARRLAARPVVAAPAYHLGSVRHMDAAALGHTRAEEDALLAALDWEADGYRLFGASTLAASSARGWFAPMGESNSLFMPKTMWLELGGMDEAFSLPGGGLANHDLYHRACDLPGAELVMLLGEGTFHQMHGGAATSGRFSWHEMHEEYVALRGRSFSPPTNDRLFIGRIPDSAFDHLAYSSAQAPKFATTRLRDVEPGAEEVEP